MTNLPAELLPTAALPSYSAATTDPSLTNNDAENTYAYADFTIGDLRDQINSNAAIINLEAGTGIKE